MTFSKEDLAVIIEAKNHPELLKCLSGQLGEPVDSYWNGSHTWFTELGGIELEWRLHPVSGFKMPEASRPEDLFDLALEGQIDIEHYWEGLEVFVISEETCSPDTLASHVESKLGITPDYCGLVDHEEIGNQYEQNGGNVSIIKLLVQQLND